MPIGVLINVASMVLGGLLGSLIGGKLPDTFKRGIITVFSFCAMAIGIASIVVMQNLSAVIFAVIVGTILGFAVKLDALVRRGAAAVLGKLKLSTPENSDLMLTAFILFCVSGTGIYGSLVSGMTGDHSILIAKSMLDFFTAMIFACQLKKAVCLLGIPQLILFLLLFFTARLILPLTSAPMIADFKAVGGIILLATGFSMLKIKEISVVNMLPAMLLVMPLSALWTGVIMPLL